MSGQKTAGRLQDMLEAGEYARLLSAAEAAVRGADRETRVRLRLLQAQACCRLAGRTGPSPERTTLLRTAAALLWRYRNAFRDSSEMNLLMEETGQALELPLLVLAGAAAADPEDGMVKTAAGLMQRPLFQVPFRERISRFWEEFAGREADIRREMQQGPEGIRHARASVRHVLNLVFDGMGSDLAMRDGTCELCLLPGREPVMAFAADALLQKAPEHLEGNWRFDAYRRAPDERVTLPDGTELSAGDVTVQYSIAEGGRLKLLLCAPKLVSRDGGGPDGSGFAAGRKEAERALNTLAENVLGQLFLLRHPCDTACRVSLETEDVLCLRDLPAALRKQGLDAAAPLGDWRDCMRDCSPGGGILRCRSMCPSLLEQMEEGRCSGMMKLYGAGAAAAGLSVPAEDRDSAGRFLWAMQDVLSGDLGVFLGERWSADRVSADFLAWDLAAVLESAETVLEALHLEDAEFRVLLPGAAGIPMDGWRTSAPETPPDWADRLQSG